MTGLSHAVIGWFIGQGGGSALRDRRIIAWMGVLPDVDVIAYPIGMIPSLNPDDGYQLFVETHHHYTHGIGMIALAAVCGLAFGRRRLRTAVLAGVAACVHVVCDVIGSGPEFPVYPWWPFSDVDWTVAWSIPVNEWPNLFAGFVLLAVAGLYSRSRGRTILEMISVEMDRELVRHIAPDNTKIKDPVAE